MLASLFLLLFVNVNIILIYYMQQIQENERFSFEWYLTIGSTLGFTLF